MEKIQLLIPGIEAVEVSFDGYPVAEILNPILFEEDHCYCCIYGANLHDSIKGFGHTPQEAIEDWQTAVRMRMSRYHGSDELLGALAERLGKIPVDYAAAS